MANLLSILAIGFLLGMRHATDPDHVIAVTTIVSRQQEPGRAARIGAFWGLGHTLTIFAVGAVIILLHVVVPPRLGLSMELCVAVMLILLGLANVFGRGTSSFIVHSHSHTHDGVEHNHVHAHLVEIEEVDHTAIQAQLEGRSYWRPLTIGIVHGLAGSAAVALLVLTTIKDPRWAIAYLLIFGVGTIAGMMLITMSIVSAFGVAKNAIAKRDPVKFSQRLAFASGLLSLGFGVFVAYQICVVHGLFSSHVQWTPQ